MKNIVMFNLIFFGAVVIINFLVSGDFVAVSLLLSAFVIFIDFIFLFKYLIKKSRNK